MILKSMILATWEYSPMYIWVSIAIERNPFRLFGLRILMRRTKRCDKAWINTSPGPHSLFVGVHPSNPTLTEPQRWRRIERRARPNHKIPHVPTFSRPAPFRRVVTPGPVAVGV